MQQDSGGGYVEELRGRINGSQAPEELKKQVDNRLLQLSRLSNSPTFLPELDRMDRYIEWVASLPWITKTQDSLDLVNAEKELNSKHYGLQELKDRILEYLAVMKLKQEKGEEKEAMRAPILFFVGLVGTGKTTIASSIARAMGRKFARIPFGGMGSPLDLRGQSRMHPEAEPGKVIKAIRQAGSRNPVILLDEIDRVTEEGRASIMGVLVEMLDPGQNFAFTDHYLDYPFDLSDVLFIATANNTRSVATAVMDRLEPIMMPSYTDNEKITIARDYTLPAQLRAAGIPEGGLVIDEDVWASIVRPLGFDAGIRTLERTVNGVVRKVARMIVEGKVDKVHLTAENAREFLPK